MHEHPYHPGTTSRIGAPWLGGSGSPFIRTARNAWLRSRSAREKIQLAPRTDVRDDPFGSSMPETSTNSARTRRSSALDQRRDRNAVPRCGTDEAERCSIRVAGALDHVNPRWDGHGLDLLDAERVRLVNQAGQIERRRRLRWARESRADEKSIVGRDERVRLQRLQIGEESRVEIGTQRCD